MTDNLPRAMHDTGTTLSSDPLVKLNCHKVSSSGSSRLESREAIESWRFSQAPRWTAAALLAALLCAELPVPTAAGSPRRPPRRRIRWTPGAATADAPRCPGSGPATNEHIARRTCARTSRSCSRANEESDHLSLAIRHLRAVSRVHHSSRSGSQPGHIAPGRAPATGRTSPCCTGRGS